MIPIGASLNMLPFLAYASTIKFKQENSSILYDHSALDDGETTNQKCRSLNQSIKYAIPFKS